MRIYEFNADIGVFEIRQTGHERYELWIEEELLGEYETPESAAADVAAFDTGYNEWDKFESDGIAYPATIDDWAKIDDAPLE